MNRNLRLHKDINPPPISPDTLNHLWAVIYMPGWRGEAARSGRGTAGPGEAPHEERYVRGARNI
ncbi:MAG TPA: hypothetical protein DDZ83_01100 [Nitrospinae bacterium]|nr:hypothetical protein [Nitrospinota bacterium]